MFSNKISKLVAALTEVRGERETIERNLEQLLKRREDLHSLPLPKKDFAEQIQMWLDQNRLEYPKKFRHKIIGFMEQPLKLPNIELGFNPLLIFNQNIDPDAMLFFFQKEIRAGIATTVEAMEWPEKVGPTRSERIKELEKIDKEIQQIQDQLEVLRRASRGDV